MRSKSILSFLLALSWFLLVIVIYCRIQHVIKSRLPEQVGYSLVGIFYVIRYWNKGKIRYTDTIKCILIVFWCFLQTSFALGVQFDRLVLYAFFVLGAIWCIAEVIDVLKKRTGGSRLILLLGGMLLGLQIVMRMLHYPGASIVMILAYLLVTIGFISDLVQLAKISWKT